MFLQYQIPVDIVTFKTPDEKICMTFFMNMKDFAFTVFLGEKQQNWKTSLMLSSAKITF